MPNWLENEQTDKKNTSVYCQTYVIIWTAEITGPGHDWYIIFSIASDQLYRDSVDWVGVITTVKKARWITEQFTQFQNKGILQ